MPVRLTSREALRILDVAEIWAARSGQEIRLVSANDHAHTRGSAHYAGLALDFHSSDPDGLAAALRGAGYRVLWRVRGHFSHVHVEDRTAVPTPTRTRRPDLLLASSRPGPARAAVR
jgi:hypothetical protein